MTVGPPVPEPTGSDPLTRIVLEEVRALRTEMNQRLDRSVTTESFVDERLRVDQRYGALGQDIVDERTSRKAEVLTERTDRKADVESLRIVQAKIAANVRWAFAAIVLPTAGIITTIVLYARGGIG